MKEQILYKDRMGKYIPNTDIMKEKVRLTQALKPAQTTQQHRPGVAPQPHMILYDNGTGAAAAAPPLTCLPHDQRAHPARPPPTPSTHDYLRGPTTRLYHEAKCTACLNILLFSAGEREERERVLTTFCQGTLTTKEREKQRAYSGHV